MVTEYRGHAQRLDQRYSPGASTPVMERLESFTAVRGLVAGQYGEGSADVHHLSMEIARRLARHSWREFGARSEREALSFTTTMVRRTVGVGILLAHARHRLRRVPLAGVDRPTFDRLRQAAAGLDRRGGWGGHGSGDRGASPRGLLRLPTRPHSRTAPPPWRAAAEREEARETD